MWLAGFVLSLLRAGREGVEAMRQDRWVDRRMNVPCQDMMDVVCVRVLCDRTRSGCVFRVFVDESVQEVEEGRCYVYGYKLLLAALLITLSDVPFRVACGGRRSSSPPRWCRTPTIPTQPSCLTSQTCVCTSEDLARARRNAWRVVCTWTLLTSTCKVFLSVHTPGSIHIQLIT
jgi:hypothetical protein